MKKYLFSLSIFAMLLSAGCTATLNNRKPFSAFTGKQVVLLQPCILEEYIAGNPFFNGELYTYYENDRPTEFVFDQRLFAKPAKTIPGDIKGFDSYVYPAADYHNRLYTLIKAVDDRMIAWRKKYGGPYREYALPAGTKVIVTRSYFFNGIDSLRFMADGTLTIPDIGRTVKFSYTFEAFSSKEGSTAWDILGRAPWEDGSVPERRFVGWNGKQYKE